MKTAAAFLLALQVIASLVAVIAALINFESILVTGPALTVTGLLFGAVTNRLGSPLVLVYALSGPIVCSVGALLIAANHWGPAEARSSLAALLAAYVALNIPVAFGVLWRIRQIPNELPLRPQFKWQFSLKSMLIVMTAVCVLITAGQLLVHYLPDYPWGRLFNSYWPGFGGFALVTLLLSAVVYRYFRDFKSRVARDAPVE